MPLQFVGVADVHKKNAVFVEVKHSTEVTVGPRLPGFGGQVFRHKERDGFPTVLLRAQNNRVLKEVLVQKEHL